MVILLCKLALAPAFVVLVSLSVRRFGPRVGGIFGGLPVVAGPILFVYALDQGTGFAGEAAANSLAALIALTAFVLAVAFTASKLLPSDEARASAAGDDRAAERVGVASTGGRQAARAAWASVVVGWVAFVSVAAVVAALGIPPVVGLVACLATFALALRVLPHPDPAAVAVAPMRPKHDLALRAGAAAAMVLLLTSVAGALGPAASGVLAPFPTITSVLTGFAVAHETRATTLHLMRGMTRGFFSFAAFLFVVAVAVEPLGTAPAFLLAIVATAAVQFGLLIWLSKSTAPAPAPAPVSTRV